VIIRNGDTSQNSDDGAPQGSVNEHYRALAFELDDGDKGNFLSGWQCDNPFVGPLLEAVRRRCAKIDYCKYTYFDADEALSEAVLDFHARVDRARPIAALSGAGASPLIFSFITYLAKLKVKQVYYVPPVYHTIPVALDRYNISMVPVSEKQPYEDGFSLNLPSSKNSMLFMTDPVWYAGAAVSDLAFERIAQWQRDTSSVIFVDGSMQYLPWSGALDELTCQLDQNFTFRLVSPSKQLAIHGYRFAYLLMPENAHPDLAWIYANICGPASAESIEFAHEAMIAISEQRIPQSLINLAASRYKHLAERGIIEADPQPDRGFSVFAKVKSRLPTDYPVLDGRFFDQASYPSRIKVNLLSPSINLLL
jgi:aspartate/methionine/tyrosine aminotransferase